MRYLILGANALLLLALSLPSIALAVPYAAATTQAAQAFVADEVLVRFKPGMQARARAAHAALGIRRVAVLPSGAERVSLPSGTSVEQALARYDGMPDVAYAEPNYIVHKVAVPTDPLFSLQWAMQNTGQTVQAVTGLPGADIKAVAAWQRHVGNGSVIVATLDTGIDYNHPELAANVWRNPAEVAGNGFDDDANGFVDDIRGWNFARNNNDPLDDDPEGHGTHVAGIIGAAGNNGVGVAGVNWFVQLMPLKVLRNDGFGTVADIAAAMDYAAIHGARVVNASYAFSCGSTVSLTEREGIDRLAQAGVLFVAAAGNDGCDNDVRPTWPGSHPVNNVLSVGASDSSDRRAFFSGRSSSYGSRTVHLFAPGQTVYSTVPQSLGHYDFLSGTSMAAPFVSGAAALLLSYRPALTMRAARETLLLSAGKPEALAGLSISGGRLDLDAMLAFDLTGSVPATPGQLQATATGTEQIRLSWLDDSVIEDGWRIERRTAMIGEYFPLAEIATSGAMREAWLDGTAQSVEGTYHGYRIQAFNAAGASARTAEAAVSRPPNAPSVLVAAATAGGVRINWQDNSLRETEYRVERAIDEGLFSEVATLTTNTTSFDDPDSQPATRYRYRVRAFNPDAGYSGYSSAVTITTAVVGGTPGKSDPRCFIATAAWGSSDQSDVQILRHFRDRYLLTNDAGRAFTDWYYGWSPHLARAIAESVWMKATVRTALKPLVWLAAWLLGDELA